MYFTYLPNIAVWKQLNLDLGYRSTSALWGSQSVLSVFSSGRYLKPRMNVVFVIDGLRIIPAYEGMVHFESGEHVHRVSLRFCKFFEDGKYILVTDIERLHLSDDVNYTEFRGALHSDINKNIVTTLDIIWDLMDKKVRHDDEETRYAIKVIWSVSYRVFNWLNMSAGFSYSHGIETVGQFKGLGRVVVTL